MVLLPSCLPACGEFRGGHTHTHSDNREESTVETHGKRFTTTSRLRLTPTAEDDYTDFSCQAKHKALQPDMPMRVTVQLSVLCTYIYIPWAERAFIINAHVYQTAIIHVTVGCHRPLAS